MEIETEEEFHRRFAEFTAQIQNIQDEIEKTKRQEEQLKEEIDNKKKEDNKRRVQAEGTTGKEEKRWKKFQRRKELSRLYSSLPYTIFRKQTRNFKKN